MHESKVYKDGNTRSLFFSVTQKIDLTFKQNPHLQKRAKNIRSIETKLIETEFTIRSRLRNAWYHFNWLFKCNHVPETKLQVVQWKTSETNVLDVVTLTCSGKS